MVLANTMARSRLEKNSGPAPFLFFAVRPLMPLEKVDQHFVPPSRDRFHRRPHGSIQGKFDLSPTRNLKKSIPSPSRCGLGMNNCALPQKEDPASVLFDHLEGAASATEATHLHDIGNVEKIRRLIGRSGPAFDCREQRFAVDRLWKNFCFGDFQWLLFSPISGEEQSL